MIRDLIMILIGSAVTGIVAHRKPEWFNKAVVTVNAIDDKINAAVKDAISKVSPPTPPAA